MTTPVSFITTTVVNWVDVFTRPVYCDIITEALTYNSTNKGLQIHAWVLMTNHLHLIASTANDCPIANTIRDFKKFTSRNLITAISENPQESRRDWLLRHFARKNSTYQFWQEGYDEVKIHNIQFLSQKFNYLHNNPVKAGIVEHPWEYRYSSAPYYADNRKPLVPICPINFGIKSY